MNNLPESFQPELSYLESIAIPKELEKLTKDDETAKEFVKWVAQNHPEDPILINQAIKIQSRVSKALLKARINLN